MSLENRCVSDEVDHELTNYIKYLNTRIDGRAKQIDGRAKPCRQDMTLGWKGCRRNPQCMTTLLHQLMYTVLDILMYSVLHWVYLWRV